MDKKTKSPERSRRILIIDDEPALFMALVDKFTRSGFTVLIAKDGREGLKSAFTNHPDLILLDIIMPIMDGITMFYKLRKDSWGKGAKVVLLTNLSDPGKVTRPLINSVNGYLVKSDWKLADIVKKVKEKLEN